MSNLADHIREQDELTEDFEATLFPHDTISEQRADLAMSAANRVRALSTDEMNAGLYVSRKAASGFLSCYEDGTGCSIKTGAINVISDIAHFLLAMEWDADDMIAEALSIAKREREMMVAEGVSTVPALDVLRTHVSAHMEAAADEGLV